MNRRALGRRSGIDLSSAALGLLSGGLLAFAGFWAGRGGAEADRVFDEPGERSVGPLAAAETGRGRHAGTPREIPAKGWRDILWRTFGEFSDDRLLLVSAGVTFYVLLALFPAITALISIYGLFTDPVAINEQLQGLAGILPGGAVSIIGEQMQRVTAHSDGKLGFGMIFGLGLALWSANAGMKTLFDALNIVYEEEEKRGFVRLTLVSLAFTLGTLVFLVLALSGIVVLPVALKFVGLGGLESWLLLLRWPVLLVVVAAGLSLIYRVGPSRRPAKWRWLTWGSALAAVLWSLFSILFSWYVQNFGNYDETYGSLGAAIGFMTWIWISTVVVLLGAELNAEIEHQTAEDSTAKSPRPMGQRGAEMADTLGEAR
ncbi:YihY/virulence factor BrkB family protein [Aureimonas endophytica]|nr:YihY/virulence factor BrkB family protein [Aureimonas endophytica]